MRSHSKKLYFRSIATPAPMQPPHGRPDLTRSAIHLAGGAIVATPFSCMTRCPRGYVAMVQARPPSSTTSFFSSVFLRPASAFPEVGLSSTE